MTWRSPPSNKHFAYKGGGILTYQNFCVRPLAQTDEKLGAYTISELEKTVVPRLREKVWFINAINTLASRGFFKRLDTQQSAAVGCIYGF
jgi:hypothetical protein